MHTQPNILSDNIQLNDWAYKTQDKLQSQFMTIMS